MTHGLGPGGGQVTEGTRRLTDGVSNAGQQHLQDGARHVGQLQPPLHGVVRRQPRALRHGDRRAADAEPVRRRGRQQHVAQVELLGASVGRVVDRLDGLLFVLKTCKGEVCRAPWAALLPGKGVQTLRDALDAQFDGYFAQLLKVDWQQCVEYYDLGSSSPCSRRGPTRCVRWASGSEVVDVMCGFVFVLATLEWSVLAGCRGLTFLCPWFST